MFQVGGGFGNFVMFEKISINL